MVDTQEAWDGNIDDAPKHAKNAVCRFLTDSRTNVPAGVEVLWQDDRGLTAEAWMYRLEKMPCPFSRSRLSFGAVLESFPIQRGNR